MEPLAKLLVSLVELAETELAMFKHGVVRLALSLGMVVGAVFMGLIGLCWVFYALFLWLVMLTNVPTAYAIGGVIFLATAGILGVTAFKNKKPAKVIATNAPPVQSDVAPRSVGQDDKGTEHDPAAPIRLAS